MNKLKISTLSPIFSAMLATGFTANAIAAEAPSEEVEHIEVRGKYTQGYGAHDVSGASRLNLSIVEIPQSVSVITNAQLQDFQLNDINEALDSATGINVERIETDRTYYTARGFDITNFQIDGVGLPLTNGNTHADEDTAIYERVEVIRGANGLMTGVGNPSATINFIRKRPTVDQKLSVNASVGSWGKKRIEVDASTPITENIAARVVAVKQDKESYLDRYETDKSILYAFIEANLSENTSISLSHSYLNNDATGNLWGALPLYYTDGSATDYDTSTSTSAEWSNWKVVKNNTVVELAHHFNDSWSLRGTYSHKTTDEDTELFYVWGTPDKQTELGLNGYASEYDFDDKHDLLDIYANGEFNLFGREHQLVVGVNYAKMSYIDTSLYDYVNGFPPLPNLNQWDGKTAEMNFNAGETGSDITEKQSAAYFTARFSIVDDLHVITGGRYNKWQVSGESYGVNETADEAEFIPYLGAVYQIIPDVVAYASYTETFVSQVERDIHDKILAPITGESKELGIKSELFEGKLIASLAYFDVIQKNLAKLDPTTVNLPIDQHRHIGVDGISSDGFEIDVAGELYPGLQVSLGYTDFTIKGDETVAGYTPSKLFKLGATYDFQQVAGLTVGVNMRWQDDISREQGVVAESFSNAGSTIITTQAAYSVVNLMARYQLSDHMSLTVNANNVTDEKYINSLYWAQGYYAAPASYNATFSWSL